MAFKNITTEGEFVEALNSAPGRRVIVQVGRQFCGPCAMAEALLKKMEQSPGGFDLVKIDCDKAPALAARLNVSTVPAFAIYQDNVVVETFVGLRTRGYFCAALGLDLAAV